MGQITRAAWKNTFSTFHQFNTGTCATSKTTTVASKTTKTMKQMPLVMQCHINNEKTSSSTHTGSPWANWRLPVRSARLGWLPRQATLPVHGGWRGTWTNATGHEVSNQWEKFYLPQQKPKPLEPELPRSRVEIWRGRILRSSFHWAPLASTSCKLQG